MYYLHVGTITVINRQTDEVTRGTGNITNTKQTKSTPLNKSAYGRIDFTLHITTRVNPLVPELCHDLPSFWGR